MSTWDVAFGMLSACGVPYFFMTLSIDSLLDKFIGGSNLQIALFVFVNVVSILISAVQTAMLVRAIFSWFPIEPNRFTDFLHVITEPFIVPVRALLAKFHLFEGLPIDMSFFITFMLLSLLNMFL